MHRRISLSLALGVFASTGAAAAQTAPAAAPPASAAPAAPPAPAADAPVAAQLAPPPPVAAVDAKPDGAGSGKVNVELSTLRILRDKGILSEQEYESALKDVGASSAKAPDANTLVIGKFATTLYGFVEADYIHDTTQSFTESAGNGQVARPGTYAGDNARTQFTLRNTRLGFRSKAPEYHGIRASAQLEMDFLGNQMPIGYSGSTISEAAYYGNATFRARHLNVKLETPVVDLLFGQYWQLFGWQSAYHPNTVEIQGVPGQLYSRTPQLRVSKTIKTDDVTFEIAIAAMRPPQRDSAYPEGQAGLRFAFNKWTGVQSPGATTTQIAPLSVAVTADVKHVALPDLAGSPPSRDSREKTGTGLAVDAFIPVIPGSKEKMGNSLSLNGEFATGYGIGDQYTGIASGLSFPAVPNPNNASPAPTYPQNIDNGIAYYDASGVLHFVQWTSYLVGVQYYFPGVDGKIWLSANYSHLQSSNAVSFGVANAKTRSAIDWFDVNLFTDVTPAVRFGLEYANFNDNYNDGSHAINHRFQGSAFYLF